MQFTLTVLFDTYAICRLDADAQVPVWAQGPFVSVTRTSDELSILCPQHNVPVQIPAQREWRCLKIEGPLDLAATGVLASLTGPLAVAQLSTFVVSTFDTDYLIVKEDDLDSALEVFMLEGHDIVEQFRPTT